jgi:hypothetical protein
LLVGGCSGWWKAFRVELLEEVLRNNTQLALDAAVEVETSG